MCGLRDCRASDVSAWQLFVRGCGGATCLHTSPRYLTSPPTARASTLVRTGMRGFGTASGLPDEGPHATNLGLGAQPTCIRCFQDGNRDENVTCQHSLHCIPCGCRIMRLRRWEGAARSCHHVHTNLVYLHLQVLDSSSI